MQQSRSTLLEPTKVRNLPSCDVLIKQGREALAQFDRYFSQVDPNSVSTNATLPAPEQLPALRAAIESDLEAAGYDEAHKFAKYLATLFRIGDNLAEPKMFLHGVAEETAAYPLAVLKAAVSQLRRRHSWMPSIAEICNVCDEHVAPLKNRLTAVTAIERETARRQKEQHSLSLGQRTEQRRAHFYQWLTDRLGAEAPELHDCRYAWAAITHMIGDTAAKSWKLAMDRAERWAAKAARFMGIVGRGLELESQRRIDLLQLQAIARAAALDEALARSCIADIAAGRIALSAPPGRLLIAQNTASLEVPLEEYVRAQYRAIEARAEDGLDDQSAGNSARVILDRATVGVQRGYRPQRSLAEVALRKKQHWEGAAFQEILRTETAERAAELLELYTAGHPHGKAAFEAAAERIKAARDDRLRP
jgi:hypothetical protein